MTKRIISTLMAVFLLFSLISCKPDNTKTPPKAIDKHFFRQTTYSHGYPLFGATGKECTFYSNDYDEIISALELLESGYKLDELTYAFNYDDDAFTVSYEFIVNPKGENFDPDSISSLSDCVPAASFIYYVINISIEGLYCNVKHSEHTEDHTATIRLLFDDAQPEAPKILDRSLLSYEVSDDLFLPQNEPQYLYAITYDGDLLFYIASCFELNNDIFSFFKEHLVQFDGRRQ